MKTVFLRLKPNQDLKKEIERIVSENNIKAGVIVSMVGSLKKANLRMAGGKEIKKWEGDLEIVSVTGTLSKNGSHIHISVSDFDGNVFGGHLKENCIINTTVELGILVFSDLEFIRKMDEESGWKELVVRNKITDRKEEVKE